MSKIFLKVSQAILAILVFLIPLFILPFTSDFFAFPKINLFLGGILVVCFLQLLAIFQTKKIELRSSPFAYSLFLIFFVHLISLLVNFKNLEVFNGAWTVLVFLGFLVFSTQIVTFFNKKASFLPNLLIAAGFITSGLGIFLFLLPANKYPLNFEIFGFPFSIFNSSFSPIGNHLASLIFLVSLIPLLFAEFSKFFNQKAERLFFLKVILESLVCSVVITGLGIFIFQVISLNKPLILPVREGWAIAVETLKNPANALFGVGPGNFLSAFTRSKSVIFNQSNLWTVRFLSSTNEIFQILTTLGLAGLAAWFYLFLKFLKNSKRGANFYSSLVLFGGMVFVPFNFVLWFLLIIYLSLLSIESIGEKESELKTSEFGNQTTTAIVVIGLLIIITPFYLLARSLMADINFQRSLIAASQNKGVDTYNWQIKAISLNPYRADFHQVYSQTNLALANSLAGKKELTDQEKEMITQLIQQAIREARNAVSLAPLNINYWENLASTYRQLINFAQGAENWAIASYNQAVRLDPNNPQQYLNLGGLYYSLTRFDEAINLFQTSIALKPDFANGWYNLAAAYNQKKEYQKALDALTQVARLVPVDSADYKKVQEEIEEVKKKLPVVEEKPAKGEKTLTLPEPLPTPQPEITPIELPPAEKATSSP